MTGRILLYRSGALGDTLLTLPALDALRRRHSGAEITLAAHPPYAAPLLGAGRADALLDAGAPPFHLLRQPPDPADALSRLLRGFELIVLLARDPGGAAAARLRALEIPQYRIADPIAPQDFSGHAAEWSLRAIPPPSANISKQIWPTCAETRPDAARDTQTPPTGPQSEDPRSENIRDLTHADTSQPAGSRLGFSRSGATRTETGSGHASTKPGTQASTQPGRPPRGSTPSNDSPGIQALDQASTKPSTQPDIQIDPLMQTDKIQEDALKYLLERINPQKPYFTVHPGGGGRPKWPPTAALAAIARRLVRETGLAPLLIQGHADAAPAAAFEEIWPEPLPRLESPRLDFLSAILARTAAHLGGDSGVTHLAALSGAPALALMGPPLVGPTDPARWAPIGARTAWVYWDQLDEGAEILIGLMGLGG
ncbi:MAG: glycosyltransferase family 9 protein [Nitrospinota bacterium]